MIFYVLITHVPVIRANGIAGDEERHPNRNVTADFDEKIGACYRTRNEENIYLTTV